MLFLCTNIAGVLTHYPSEVAKRQVIITMIIIGKIMIITNLVIVLMFIIIKMMMIRMMIIRLSWRRDSASRLDSPPSARINNRC